MEKGQEEKKDVTVKGGREDEGGATKAFSYNTISEQQRKFRLSCIHCVFLSFSISFYINSRSTTTTPSTTTAITVAVMKLAVQGSKDEWSGKKKK